MRKSCTAAAVPTQAAKVRTDARRHRWWWRLARASIFSLAAPERETANGRARLEQGYCDLPSLVPHLDTGLHLPLHAYARPPRSSPAHQPQNDIKTSNLSSAIKPTQNEPLVCTYGVG